MRGRGPLCEGSGAQVFTEQRLSGGRRRCPATEIARSLATETVCAAAIGLAPMRLLSCCRQTSTRERALQRVTSCGSNAPTSCEVIAIGLSRAEGGQPLCRVTLAAPSGRASAVSLGRPVAEVTRAIFCAISSAAAITVKAVRAGHGH